MENSARSDANSGGMGGAVIISGRPLLPGECSCSEEILALLVRNSPSAREVPLALLVLSSRSVREVPLAELILDSRSARESFFSLCSYLMLAALERDSRFARERLDSRSARESFLSLCSYVMLAALERDSSRCTRKRFFSLCSSLILASLRFPFGTRQYVPPKCIVRRARSVRHGCPSRKARRWVSCRGVIKSSMTVRPGTREGSSPLFETRRILDGLRVVGFRAGVVGGAK